MRSPEIEDAMRKALAAAKELPKQPPRQLNYVAPSVELELAPVVPTAGGVTWNSAQLQAITNGLEGKSFCLIGSAGTGKTTTLRGLLQQLIKQSKLPMLQSGTACLNVHSPGVVLVSYTRRAVRNIARQMPAELKHHCVTIHKLLEFAPETYTEMGPEGEEVKKMRFAPQRNATTPLPRDLKTIIIDESSMVSIDLMNLVLDALPNKHNVQFIFLGDLNQLPPVYGDAILGKALLELPIVELTQVYRQALESPIIALALAVKNNNFKIFNEEAHTLWNGPAEFDVRNVTKKITFNRPGRGSVTIQPWKSKYEMDDALHMLQGQINKWIDTGEYKPDEDLILCPWKVSFGCEEMNRGIAQRLTLMRDLEVFEVIAGYNKHYFCVGDKLLMDKQEAIIEDIFPNPKYVGRKPAKASKKLTRWGANAEIDLGATSNQDIEELLANLADVEDRTAESSHVLRMRMLDSEEIVQVTKSAVINNSVFAYAITVHKAQGSECRKVFFLTHYCHSKMLFRELVYTAITRAAEELHIVCSPKMLDSAGCKPRIKGDTLEAKLAFYAERLKERLE